MYNWIERLWKFAVIWYCNKSNGILYSQMIRKYKNIVKKIMFVLMDGLSNNRMLLLYYKAYLSKTKMAIYSVIPISKIMWFHLNNKNLTHSIN